MAFPDGWGRSCELQIQASKIDATLAYFPVLFEYSNLPTEMFDADGSYPGLEGGGDIRFSSNESGSTQLACEIVSFHIDNTPTNGYAEIWVEVPSISSSVTTSIWVWYNKAAESQPAEGATYGKHDNWDDGGGDYFKLVQHMDGTGTTLTDSTGYSNDATKSASTEPAESAAGQIRECQSFDGGGAGDDFVTVESHASLDFTTAITMEAWCYLTSAAPQYHKIIAKQKDVTYPYQFDFGSATTDQIRFQLGTVNDTLSTDDIPQDTWTYIVGTYDQSDLRLYINGFQDTTAPDTAAMQTSTTQFLIGGRPAPSYFTMPGLIDEVRLSNTPRSAAWIKACWYNQDAPGEFALEQTPQSPSAYKLEGIVYDNEGAPLGFCDVVLFKDNLDNTVTFIDIDFSAAGTGAYSFTGIADNDPQYFVIAWWEDGTADKMDVTDHVLQPVAE